MSSLEQDILATCEYWADHHASSWGALYNKHCRPYRYERHSEADLAFALRNLIARGALVHVTIQGGHTGYTVPHHATGAGRRHTRVRIP